MPRPRNAHPTCETNVGLCRLSSLRLPRQVRHYPGEVGKVTPGLQPYNLSNQIIKLHEGKQETYAVPFDRRPHPALGNRTE